MTENEIGQLPGNKLKGKEVAKGSIVGNMSRKCLADISNLPKSNHDMKIQAYSPNTKEYIHKLHQENVSLVKLLADRNKIIQFHALELQKLRTICQQVQQKNLQLAQTNSQMLEELNSAKDRLKVLQHELGCKNGLLTLRNLESEVEPINCDEVGKSSREDSKNNVPHNKKRMRRSKSLDNNRVPVQVQEKIDGKRRSIRLKNVEQLPTDGVLEISNTHLTDKTTQKGDKVDEKRRHSRRHSTRFKVREEEPTAMFERSDTMKPEIVELAQAEHISHKEIKYENEVDDKRQYSKRQSTRFKVNKEEPTATVESSGTMDLTTSKPAEAETKTDDESLSSRRQSSRYRHQEQVQEPTEDSGHASPLHKYNSTSSASSSRSKIGLADYVPGSEDSESRRTSIRPKRQATEKVQSYKEIPVNKKMRRHE